MDPNPTSDLAEAAAGLHREPDVESTVQSVLQYAQELTGGDGVAVMLRRGSRPAVLSATSPAAERADRVQLECAEGPGLQAMSARDAVVVDDTAADSRWSSWGRPVCELGFRSVLSLSLGTSRSSLGALSVYSAKVGAFAAERAELTRFYAQHASVALVSAQRESGLRRAMNTRHAIGQAQGVLMERHGLDAGQAFALLRNSARDHGVTLGERAEQIVASRPADVG
ncbi:GAF and ANTAR domain-containing protein [Jiangella alkaliphila]|uniref:GAF domain-containing protein n=1 Tax=Jiangella alkaliphila TaxID=419479 RepID=A0A1H2G3X6_9ACTN|nr:GAF and ANTAR domain-containing protein [Jiangella alkaliphila]SDU13988.1 GAF domain-containing protein [Jiangella alkaliphila]